MGDLAAHLSLCLVAAECGKPAQGRWWLVHLVICCYDNKHENRLKGGRVYLGSWPQVSQPKAAASSALGSW